MIKNIIVFYIDLKKLIFFQNLKFDQSLLNMICSKKIHVK
ncbi:hypothetical protein RIEPE_0335 [Candidatus Riesia pediculicola USDA]|uniref:Uncharacterized protein n=1 Tax=Riesia pediculicola (strain USDA) TaxID=515618 RepID=D4G8C8_RIEPU|nr:hypothetical protein RIEPE_0335 [Candidatus Riesia pediculicola USDA]